MKRGSVGLGGMQLKSGVKTAVAGVGGLAMMFLAVENWRGKQDWEAFKAEWGKKGEVFDYRQVIPKAVPAKKNFALIPQFEPLFNLKWGEDFEGGKPVDPEAFERAKDVVPLGDDLPDLTGWRMVQRVDLKAWQKHFRARKEWPKRGKAGDAAEDVLLALRRHEGPLSALAKAAQERPLARYDVKYEAHFSALFPHLMPLRQYARVYSLRALARLRAGKPKEALEDVLMAVFLAETIKDEPILISHLVRMAILEMALQPVWEGLADGLWEADQQAALRERLGGINLIAHYQLAMRGERDLSNLMMDQLRGGNRKKLAAMLGVDEAKGALLAMAPEGFIYQNQLRVNQLHMMSTFNMADAKKRRIYPERGVDLEQLIKADGKNPYNIFAAMLMPAVGTLVTRTGATQSALDHAVIACGLELARGEGGGYPVKLVGERKDVVTGKPMGYRREGERYILYSVGWNRKDDGGKPVVHKPDGKRADFYKGDWVWRYEPVKNSQ